jgi:acetyltransferase-like isoleucine patch superfamily enzyme
MALIHTKEIFNLSNFKKEIYAWIEALLGIFPGHFGKYFRMMSYSILFKEFRGKKFTLGQGCQVWFPWHMKIGEYSHISRNCQIEVYKPGDVELGNYVMIGPYSIITTVTHNFDKFDIPIKLQGMSSTRIVIEDNVWIGAHVVILPGVRIHSGSIVGAGAVVTKDVAANSIVGGIPAKVVGWRSDTKTDFLVK